MTSENGVRTGWSCGWSSILEELGRIATLEYPIHSPQREDTIHSSHAKTPLTRPAPTKPPSTPTSVSAMPSPRLSFPRPAVLRPNLSRSSPILLRPISTSGPPLGAWTGRTPEDHAVNRTDEKDVQSKQSQQGMREKANGDSPSIGISENGGEYNKKAEQDKPRAPKPVIGMNDERGGKGH
jgi:hypothetical protein